LISVVKSIADIRYFAFNNPAFNNIVYCAADDTVAAKLLSYNRANRAVAVLCNHQRAAPKNFEVQMSKIQEKVSDK
jgi:hypothetical protein